MAERTAGGGGAATSARPPTTDTTDLIARRQLWPLAEAAYQLGISIPTLNRRVRAGQLAKIRHGSRSYIADAELRRFIADLEAAATA